MRLVSDILLQLAMLDIGIVPYASGDSVVNEKNLNLIDKRIASMCPQEQKLVKRKFRKLWKKAIRALNHDRARHGHSKIEMHVYVTPGRKPSELQRRNRRGIVLWYLKNKLLNTGNLGFTS